MRVRNLLITGGKEMRKLDEEKFVRLMCFSLDMKERIERELEREITEKEFEQLQKLLLGIVKKYGVFDERYHLYLVGILINNYWCKK